MFNLIPVSLLIGALGGILYIASNHLSELNSEEEKNDFSGFNFKARLAEYAKLFPLDTVKSQSLAITRIALHRFRVALLKTDNHLIKLISKISQSDKANNAKNNAQENIPDFWEKVAKSEEEIIPLGGAPKTEIKIDFAVKTAAYLGEPRPAAAGREAAKKFFDIKPAKKTLKTKKSLK